jgi:hypothetical protein
LTVATVDPATGEDIMRNSETYFEQVPIEVVQSIIQREKALDSPREKSRAPVLLPEQRGARKFPKSSKDNSAKGNS